MEVTLYLRKRRGGKTTDIVNEFLAKPAGTFIITSHANIRHLRTIIPTQYWKRIRSFSDNLGGYKINKLLVDDVAGGHEVSLLTAYAPLMTVDCKVKIYTSLLYRCKKNNYFTGKFLTVERINNLISTGRISYVDGKEAINTRKLLYALPDMKVVETEIYRTPSEFFYD